MIIDVSKIMKNSGASIKIDEKIAIDDLTFNGDDIKFLTPFSVVGEIINKEDILHLEAKVNVKIHVLCSKCVADIKRDFNFEIKEKLSPNGNGEDYLIIELDKIDLSEIVVQNFCLNVPMTFLCKEDCKGLCSFCGQDLNISNCTCDAEQIDPRLEALKAFLTQS